MLLMLLVVVISAVVGIVLVLIAAKEITYRQHSFSEVFAEIKTTDRTLYRWITVYKDKRGWYLLARISRITVPQDGIVSFTIDDHRIYIYMPNSDENRLEDIVARRVPLTTRML